jgi:hypothetical protein
LTATNSAAATDGVALLAADPMTMPPHWAPRRITVYGHYPKIADTYVDIFGPRRPVALPQICMNTLLRFFCIGLLAMTLPQTAHAYVDPGSGMLLWQGLIAGVGAIFVFWRRLANACRRWLQHLRAK